MREDGRRNRQGNSPEDPVPMWRLAPSPLRLIDGGNMTSMHGELNKAGLVNVFPFMLVNSAARLAKDVQPESPNAPASARKGPGPACHLRCPTKNGVPTGGQIHDHMGLTWFRSVWPKRKRISVNCWTGWKQVRKSSSRVAARPWRNCPLLSRQGSHFHLRI